MDIMSNSFDPKDRDKIKKLNALDNPNTFWNDVKKLSRNTVSKRSLKRWDVLANKRYHELTKHVNKPYELIFYFELTDKDSNTGFIEEYRSRSYTTDVFFRKTYYYKEEKELLDALKSGLKGFELNNRNFSLWNREVCIYAGRLTEGAIEEIEQYFRSHLRNFG